MGSAFATKTPSSAGIEELAAVINARLTNLTQNDIMKNGRNIKNLRERIDAGMEYVQIV